MSSVDSPEFGHIPVLADEVLELLSPSGEVKRIIDGTLGLGGHSSLMLKKYSSAELLGIDRDGEALSGAQKVLAFASDRIRLVRGGFGSLADYAAEAGWAEVDMILLDVGVSSMQIDNPQRGFTFRQDGPLDMRMDKRSPGTASRLVNSAPYGELERIFREYGEVEKSRKLAAAIVEQREIRPLVSTADLAEICDKVMPKIPGKKTLPAPTLCFQALRIAVNDELGELERALKGAIPLLRKGGRIGIISFHSLEDRIVKNFFRLESTECLCPPGLPVCRCGHLPRLKLINKKPATASDKELEMNPRSAPAKLRVAERL